MIRPRLRTVLSVLGAISLVVFFFQVVSRGAVAPSITSLSPTSGLAGTPVTITGANFVTDLLVGKIGWWGPFQTGVVPKNLIVGAPDGAFVGYSRVHRRWRWLIREQCDDPSAHR